MKLVRRVCTQQLIFHLCMLSFCSRFTTLEKHLLDVVMAFLSFSRGLLGNISDFMNISLCGLVRPFQVDWYRQYDTNLKRTYKAVWQSCIWNKFYDTLVVKKAFKNAIPETTIKMSYLMMKPLFRTGQWLLWLVKVNWKLMNRKRRMPT